MIKQVGWFIFGLFVITIIAILHELKIIKTDDEYGF
jgi:hypothetical protein